MIDLKNEEVRNTVREHDGLIARKQSEGCGCGDGCCPTASKESAANVDCGCSSACCGNAGAISQVLGYNIETLHLACKQGRKPASETNDKSRHTQRDRNLY